MQFSKQQSRGGAPRLGSQNLGIHSQGRTTQGKTVVQTTCVAPQFDPSHPRALETAPPRLLQRSLTVRHNDFPRYLPAKLGQSVV